MADSGPPDQAVPAAAATPASISLQDLPVELLELVFASLTTPTRLLVLPRVCRLWRAVTRTYVAAAVDLAPDARYITDEVLFHLAQNTALKSLSLDDCHGISEVGHLNAKAALLGIQTIAHCTALYRPGWPRSWLGARSCSSCRWRGQTLGRCSTRSWRGARSCIRSTSPAAQRRT
jgi:hypothetical protein